MILHQIHTVASVSRSYGSYPDPPVAVHMRDHLADVLRVPLVVESIEGPTATTAEVAR